VGGLGEHLLVHVAQRHDLDGRDDLDESEQRTLAVPAGADQADPQRLGVGGGDEVAGEGSRAEAGRGRLEGGTGGQEGRRSGEGGGEEGRADAGDSLTGPPAVGEWAGRGRSGAITSARTATPRTPARVAPPPSAPPTGRGTGGTPATDPASRTTGCRSARAAP